MDHVMLREEYYRLMDIVGSGYVSHGLLMDSERQQAYRIRQILRLIFNTMPEQK